VSKYFASSLFQTVGRF